MKPVNVVIPCCIHDQGQAISLIRWIAELGKVDAQAYLACTRSCAVETMLKEMGNAFTKVGFIEDAQGMESNWREIGSHQKSARGPNSLFSQIAWYFQIKTLGPWLFLEPDAVPCHPEWYNRLNASYHNAQMPFFGYKVTSLNHKESGDIPTHLSGVAIYPDNTPSLAKQAVLDNEVAFDITGASEIIPRAHFTTLIHHHYRAPSFVSQQDLDERVSNEVVIFHANKDLSLLPFLRKRLGMNGGVAQRIEQHVSTVPVVSSNLTASIYEFRHGQLQLVA